MKHTLKVSSGCGFFPKTRQMKPQPSALDAVAPNQDLSPPFWPQKQFSPLCLSFSLLQVPKFVVGSQAPKDLASSSSSKSNRFTICIPPRSSTHRKATGRSL